VEYIEKIVSYGHENITATHTSTLEITMDPNLTLSGDCIVGTSANHPPSKFSTNFIQACQKPGVKIRADFQSGKHKQSIIGRGHQDLTFSSSHSAVIRTSNYIDDRTIIIHSDTSANNLNRELVSALKKKEKLHLTLTVT
jgi:hypothetical protein